MIIDQSTSLSFAKSSDFPIYLGENRLIYERRKKNDNGYCI